MTSSKSSQLLLFSGALCLLMSVYPIDAAPLVPAASGNSTSEQAQAKVEEKSQSALQSQTVSASTEAAVSKTPVSQQQPTQPAASAAAAVDESSAPTAAAADAAAAVSRPVLSAAEAPTLREATGLNLDSEVTPQRYDDFDLLMANLNEAEPVPEPNDINDDDEAMLQQLFTRDSRPSDVDLSPRAMAQYLILTDDFNGVQQAIQDLVSTGLLSADEADSYRDEVSLEYASMIQQNLLPPREQRDIYRLQDAYDTDVRNDVRNGAGAADYVEYDNNVLLPTLPADELPISAELAQLDASVLEELLRQQQQQQRLQLQNTEPTSEYVGNGDDELFLQAVEPETSRVSEGSAQSAADDVTNYDRQQATLEAELESLPVEVVTQQQNSSADQHAAVNSEDDEVETELEKLLQNDRSAEQDSSKKKH